MHDATLTDDEITARIRAACRCPLPRCREDRRPRGAICWNHHDELARILDPAYVGERDLDRAASIPQLFARLDPTPSATGDAGPRAPGFASQPPCDLTPIVMRDHRSVAHPVVAVWYDPHPRGYGDDPNRPHYEDEAAHRAVPKAIVGLAETVFADLRPPECSFARVVELTRHADDPYGIREVEKWCRWLHRNLDHLTAREDAVEVWRELVDLHDQLRPAAGDPKAKPIGSCTGWVLDRVRNERVECGAPLYLPPPQPGVTIDPAKPVLRCQRCDRPYSHLMLLRLEIAAERVAS